MNRTRTPHCKYCKKAFIPSLPGAVVCSPECAQSLAEKKRAKVEAYQAKEQRKDTRAKLDSLKTLPKLKAEAQAAFNRFRRLSDLAAGYNCICCDEPFGDQKKGGTIDAGHYRSVGSAPHLRFVEMNCHAQKVQHNRHGAGRAVDYRLGLIRRYGLEAVEALESDNEPRHYTKDDLRELKALYRAKARELINGLAAQPGEC